MRLEKCIQRGEIFFGMGECGLEVLLQSNSRRVTSGEAVRGRAGGGG